MKFEMEFLHALKGLHGPVQDRIMLFITRLGDNGFVWFLLCGILILLPPMKKVFNKDFECSDEYMEKVAKRRQMGCAILVVNFMTALICDYILQLAVGRARPFYVDSSFFVNTNELVVMLPSKTSFPSGHAAGAFASAFSVFFINKKAGFFVFILACLIAFSRMYFYLHYPTDILGGFIVGFICAKVAYFFGEEMAR